MASPAVNGLLDLAGAALRPAAGMAARGLDVQRAATRYATRQATDASIAALDALLTSRLAAEAVDRIVASELAQAAVSRVLEGPLVEAVAQDVVRFAVLERVADPVLADEVLERLLDRAQAAELPRLLANRLLADSRLLDDVVERLLASEELWLVVNEIAQSPAVTDAIARQSVGFADEVAGGLRSRSRRADLWLEGAARRALRRPRPEVP